MPTFVPTNLFQKASNIDDNFSYFQRPVWFIEMIKVALMEAFT